MYIVIIKFTNEEEIKEFNFKSKFNEIDERIREIIKEYSLEEYEIDYIEIKKIEKRN